MLFGKSKSVVVVEILSPGTEDEDLGSGPIAPVNPLTK